MPGRKALKRLMDAYTAFVEPLRSGDGHSDEACDELCDALDECAELWSETNAVPKQAAMAFLALNSVPAFRTMYAGDEATRIMDSAGRIHELILECLKPCVE